MIVTNECVFVVSSLASSDWSVEPLGCFAQGIYLSTLSGNGLYAVFLERDSDNGRKLTVLHCDTEGWTVERQVLIEDTTYEDDEFLSVSEDASTIGASFG